MSRMYSPKDADDNPEQILLPDEKFIQIILLPEALFINTLNNEEEENTILTDISTLKEEIIKQLEKDSNAQQIKLALENNKSDTLPFKTTRNNWII
jgi:hypothetical protein